MIALALSILLSTDTLATSSHLIDEVVVVSAATEGQKRSAKGQVASIDEHLAELSHVNLVRRGSYAWEPVVNNMATERVSTTIDGMKIFYACTDKMDPVTSYVESSNLQSILLNSGLNGNPQSTGNIGGSLDLKLRKAGFNNSNLSPLTSNLSPLTSHLSPLTSTLMLVTNPTVTSRSMAPTWLCRAGASTPMADSSSVMPTTTKRVGVGRCSSRSSRR